MTVVRNIDSIAAVEELYGSLEGSADSQSLRIPTRLRSQVVGSRAALVQFIITWARKFHDGQLLTQAGAELESGSVLTELCEEEYGIISLLMAPNVIGTNGLNVSQRARIEGQRFYFDSLQQPYQKRNRLFLVVCDHLGSALPNLAFLNLSVPGTRAQRKYRFMSYFREYLRICFQRAHAPPFRQEAGEHLSEIVYELFANTEEWGSFEIDGRPLARSARGILVELHMPQSGGPFFQNVGRDPDHLIRYLSQFAEPAPRKAALLELSVFDSGIGLAHQWWQKEATSGKSIGDEYEAVTSCFGKHGSSSRNPTRGLGLFAVMQLLTRTKGYLKFRGGHLALYRDFTAHPHPYAERREPPLVTGKGEGRRRFEFLLDWISSSENYNHHGNAKGALITVLIPLIQGEAQTELPFA